MNISLEQVSREEFGKISSDAHMVCFETSRPASFERYDYALVCYDEQKLTAYSTILEYDAETAYMQNGGALTKNGLKTVRSYLMMIEWLKKKYPVITTKISNTNNPMLKLAIQAGFLIHGVEYYNETENFRKNILLCLKIEHDNEIEQLPASGAV